MSDVEKQEVVEDHVLFKTDSLRLIEKTSSVYVKYPRVIAGVSYLVMFLLVLITIQLEYMNIGEITQDDWAVYDGDDYTFKDALTSARESIDSVTSSTGGGVLPRSEVSMYTVTQFIFEWEDGNRDEDIFTPQNLKLICEFQRILTSHAKFPLFCPTATANGTDTACSDQDFDLVSKFYPVPQDREDCPLIDDVTFALRKTALMTNPQLAFFLKKESVTDGATPTLTRSQVALAGPLGADTTADGKAFTVTITEDSDDQFQYYETFIIDDIEHLLLKHLNMEVPKVRSAYQAGPQALGSDGLQVRFHNGIIRNAEFQRQVNGDQAMAIFSVIFVGTAMVLHVRSLFLTATAMLSIVLSFPVTLFFYSAVFRVFYVTNIHIVAVFLILGVGADNVFVFTDVWKQSTTAWSRLRGIGSPKDAAQRNIYGTGNEQEEVMIARLAYTTSRAAGAVFNTAFTTFAAFFATFLTSTITPISSFGLFAAIAMAVNFFNVLLVFPALVIIHQKHFANRPFLCACFREPNPTAVDFEQEQLAAYDGNKQSGDDPLDLDTDESLTIEQKLFTRAYIPCLTVGKGFVRPVALACITGLLALMGFMAYHAIKLEPPKTADEPFADTHMFTGFMDDYSRKFFGGDDFMEVEIVWGIDSIDRDAEDPGFNRFDPTGYRGTVVFKDDFDLAPQTSQQFVLDTCARLKDFSCAPEGETAALEGCVDTQGRLIKSEDVVCTLELFHTWHNTTYPTEEAALTLGDSNKTLWTQRLSEFAEVRSLQNDIGFVGGELRFFVMSYTATLKMFQPVQTKEPIIELVDKFTEKMNTDAPTAMKGGFSMSFDIAWINVELAIVSQMLSGLLVSLLVAYVVMLFASGNIFLSTYSIITVIGILSCVLGLTELLGWALGVGEAIAAVMVIGLSVDFSLHLAHSYEAAGHEGHFDREARFKSAAIVMGATVTAGAITTAGSSAVLFLTQMAFFSKMATLISATIGFSLVYSLFMFMPLLLVIGPQGRSGDIVYFFKSLCNKAN